MHDPKNIQYLDIGTQYRSEIFYEDDTQKSEAKEILDIFNKQLNGKIQTNISQLKIIVRQKSITKNI